MAGLEMDRLCEEFEAPVPSPAGGSAAAAVAAIAASLVVMVGRGSPDWSEGADAASAAALRNRLLVLGGEDVEAVAAVLAASSASRRSAVGDGEVGDGEVGDGESGLGRALMRASQVPLESAERAADVAALVARAAHEGKRPMRADADAARILTAAATQVASSIVSGNLTARPPRHPQPDHPQEEIPRLLEAARLAAERASASSQVERE